MTGFVSRDSKRLRDGLADQTAADKGAAFVGHRGQKLSEKLMRESFSLRDAGALGDGSNCAAQLQAAYLEGQHVLIPNGEYLLSTSVTMSRPTSFIGGAKIKVGAGAVLTISAPILASNHQIIEVMPGGSVVVSDGAMTEILPKWFGGALGPNNTIQGEGAGESLIGVYAGPGTAEGDYLTFTGKDCGKKAKTLTTSSGHGYRNLMKIEAGEYLFAYGYNCLSALTAGSYNWAGGAALRDLVTGSDNTATGFGAAISITAGSENTISGANAYRLGTSGEKNTISGSQAAYRLNGSHNDISGQSAFVTATLGDSNSLKGSLTCRLVTEGSFLTTNGAQTLYKKTGGDLTTATGFQAGYEETTGSENTWDGARSGPAVGSGAITRSGGFGAGAKVKKSNQVAIGGAVGTGYEVSTGFGTDDPDERIHVSGRAAFSDGQTQPALKAGLVKIWVSGVGAAAQIKVMLGDGTIKTLSWT